MIKQCNFCGNRNVKETRTQYVYKHDGKWLVVDNVPCEQCEYCGEQYFTAKVLRKIEADFFAVHSARRKARSEMVVPVETYA